MKNLYNNLMKEISIGEMAEDNLSTVIVQTKMNLKNLNVNDELSKEILEILEILENSRNALRILLKTKVKVVNEIADILMMEENLKNK